MTWKLKRTRQCRKCPWRIATDPRAIPNGYCETRHARLAETFADQTGNLALAVAGGTMNSMACHESPVGQEAHCVGWLAHQLGPGNNIALRMAVRSCENIGRMELVGPQHARFEDTLPDPE